MPRSDPHPDYSHVVMTQSAIADAVQRIAEEIANHNGDIDSVVLLGILSRGRPLADRIAKAIGDLRSGVPRAARRRESGLEVRACVAPNPRKCWPG